MKLKHKIITAIITIAPIFAFAQLNSPYSRYGIGNLTPQANISNRSMGGISAAIADPLELNTINPATSANLLYSTLEVGLEYNGMNLKSKQDAINFRSHYAIIPYMQVGFPLLSGNQKAIKNQTSWSLNFGLRPVSRINYKIEATTAGNIENIKNIYEGEGGANQAFFGTALKVKNLSVGVNTGYLFAEKNFSNRISFQNDSVFYNRANYETETRFGGMFLNAGALYNIKIKGGAIKIGAYGNLKTSYSANQDKIIETFIYDMNGSPSRLDSVFESKDSKGTVQLPATFGAGISFEKNHILAGLDFEVSQWDDYRFYGKKDRVKNSWIARAGIQFYPASAGSNTGYFNHVKYRAGISVGEDYLDVDGKLPVYTVSVGAGFPLKLRRSFYETQYSVMNVGFEFANRGNKSNNLTESVFKVNLGFSLNDIWFRRQKYQ